MEKHRTVLVVDDDDTARESLKRLIERQGGVTCFTAENSVEALALLRKQAVQVIIADHDMPGMDGVEMLKLVAVRYPQTCRILLTARTDAETPTRALNEGQAWRFLSKPCRSVELQTALHFAFEHAEHEAETQQLRALLRRSQALLAGVRQRCPGVVEELEAKHPSLTV